MDMSYPSGKAVIRGVYWFVAALVLLAPAIAMQFTREVNWGYGDFLVMAGLLGVVGLAVEVILRAALPPVRTALSIAFAVGLFLLVWAELAVGLFD